ncbi:MICOS complex subunit Mic10 [Rhodamnia argentea]|uniref:MICOS complex subunit Mic10 n=1 Tax=Rhodamnia argentea TaxID=178133 RepID=A0A8B8NKA1_9MYRT|nr:MICOS complex subunit Mic10 [Rhodamnia argentea]
MMAEDKKEIVPTKYDVDAKWDRCVDLTVRRFFYSSLAGVFGGLLLFRSPVARWSSLAFGAGLGIGSAYTECSQKFNGFPTKPPTKPPPKASDVSAHETVVESSPQEGQD